MLANQACRASRQIVFVSVSLLTNAQCTLLNCIREQARSHRRVASSEFFRKLDHHVRTNAPSPLWGEGWGEGTLLGCAQSRRGLRTAGAPI
jgi:hypothetical protein